MTRSVPDSPAPAQRSTAPQRSGVEGGASPGPKTSAGAGPLRLPLPPELTQRGTCPFDPPPALDRIREESPVTAITLLDGSAAWLVSGYEQARLVLSDSRFSSE